MNKRIALACLASMILVACGAGGGGGAGNPNGRSPLGIATSYEANNAVNTRAALLAQLNTQGARGYAYFGPNELGGTSFNFYSKDSSNTFSYEIVDEATTLAGLLAQLNAQGARGFELSSFDTLGTVFSKENTSGSFSYELPAAQTTQANFLTQLNAQGARGFLYIGPYDVGGNSVSIYAKNNASAAQYSYRLEATSVDVNSALSQLNTQGAAGYKFGSPLFVGATSLNLYVKDTTQSSTFAWKVNPQATSSASLVNQANAEAAQSYVYWFTVFLNGGAIQRELYFLPSNCTGVLCRATSPL
jgi:hypothetical protein